MKGKPLVSVVMTCWNRQKELVRAVKSIQSQTYPNYEIIVVDQSDKKIDPTLLEGKKKIALVLDNGRGLPRASALGLKKAKGDIILFLHEDIVAQPDLIENHVRNYDNPEVGAVAGRADAVGDLPLEQITEVGKLNQTTMHMSHNFNADCRAYVDHVYGCNWSVRKELYEKTGGYDPIYFHKNGKGVGMYEDADASYKIRKMGYKIVFDPETHVVHTQAKGGSYTFPYYEKEFWTYHNKIIFYLKHMRLLLLPLFLSRQFLGILKRTLRNSATKKTLDLKLFFVCWKGLIDGAAYYLANKKQE